MATNENRHKEIEMMRKENIELLRELWQAKVQIKQAQAQIIQAQATIIELLDQKIEHIERSKSEILTKTGLN